MTLTSSILTGSVKSRALASGFDHVAIGPASPPDHGRALERWLAAGYAGTMSYLERRLGERLDPDSVLPGARSVVCVALNYFPGEPVPDSWRRQEQRNDEAAGARSRAYVDTGPVLERDLAARAGLGWTGKNTMLLHPDLGSWFLIGVLLTTAELAFDEPLPDRCGSCRACLDACPTGAFVAPYVLDARRCISYLTIEHRGDIPPALQDALGPWQFGCDVCQEVCPWNRKVPVSRETAFRPSAPYPGAERIAAMSDEELRARFQGTALLRPRPAGLRRNAAAFRHNSARVPRA